MADRPTDPDAVVRAFCEAWSRADVDELMTWFADDATYHNIPMEPCVGAEAIRTFLEGFLGMASGFTFVIHRQVDRVPAHRHRVGPLVHHEVPGRHLPVAGAFEIVDGRIEAWRDYFDMAPFTGG